MTASIGQHLATLNLFVEADGKLYVTVASADVPAVEAIGKQRGLAWSRPVDLVELLVGYAENIPVVTK